MIKPASFFFYDLETSGINPRSARIMQFAGQRTTMNLEPIGEPVNILIKLTPDVVPEPDAIMITGITPQQTLTDGITEADFLRQFTKEIAIPGTVFVGYNTVRFDDEFMRFLHYRNFYDPYEWQWKDDRSRWDLLDVVRMTRALRPDGIKWPFDSKGTPSNRLELLTAVNGLDHENAHDALNDVFATIAIARLLQEKQPKLFYYLRDMRDKKAVAALVEAGQPFVYSSGKYPSEYEKTTVALRFMDHPKKQGSLVFDLRQDPTPFLGMTAEQLAQAWKYDKEMKRVPLPVKSLQYNRCPAVAPLGVLDAKSQKRLELDLDVISRHAAILKDNSDFIHKIRQALKILDTEQQTAFFQDEAEVDARLYDGFIPAEDRDLSTEIRRAAPDTLSTYCERLKDGRLKTLIPLYKARNFPESLSDEERKEWEAHRTRMLMGGGTSSRLAKYFTRLGQLAETPSATGATQYLLEELQLYGQSIMPVADEFES